MARLLKYLANLGYGSRREVALLVAQRRVTDAQGAVLRDTDSVPHGDIRVDGEALDPPPGAVVLLHKPLGYVCSTTDATNPVVYALLPDRFARRTPVIAPIGRLDRETTGLLLLTDDGALNHRLTSPRSHVPKTYEVSLASPLVGTERDIFASGELQLAGENTPLAPADLEVLDAHHARITVREGRYHQVRRMFAAVGNHVNSLHRQRIGRLDLGDQPSGTWRVLTDDERLLLTP